MDPRQIEAVVAGVFLALWTVLCSVLGAGVEEFWPMGMWLGPLLGYGVYKAISEERR